MTEPKRITWNDIIEAWNRHMPSGLTNRILGLKRPAAPTSGEKK